MILKQDFSANVAKTLNLEHNVFFLIFEKIFIDNKSFNNWNPVVIYQK